MSDNERQLLVSLRGTGKSIGEISVILGRSRATISKYVRGIPVLPEFQKEWLSKRGGNTLRAKERKNKASSQANHMVTKISEKESLLIATCLYWGEGNKKDFGFTNSDPLMVATLISCLTDLGLDKERLKISIRVYDDVDIRLAKAHWAKIVGIQENKILSVNILRGKKRGKLPFGMCRIRITKGNDYFNLLMATVELISKKLAPIAQRTELQTPKL